MIHWCGPVRKGRPQLVSCYRDGNEARGRLDLRNSRKGLGLPSHCLLPREEWPLGLQGMPSAVWVWDKATSGRRKVKRGKSAGGKTAMGFLLQS